MGAKKRSTSKSRSKAKPSTCVEEPITAIPSPQNLATLVNHELLGRKSHPGSSSSSLLSPLVTKPFLSGPSSSSHDGSGAAQQQQFVLLPQLHFITVLSYQTGKRVGVLVLNQPDSSASDSQQVQIQSVALVDHPLAHPQRGATTSLAQLLTQQQSASSTSPVSPQLLYVGCSDGCLYEYALLDLLGPGHASSHIVTDTTSASYQLAGPIYHAQRRLQIASPSHLVGLEYLSFPSTSLEASSRNKNETNVRVTGYILVETKSTKKTQMSLQRFQIPLPPNNSNNPKDATAFVDLSQDSHTITLDAGMTYSKESRDNNNNKPIGLVSCRAPLTSDGFVVLVARPLQIQVYYDENSGSDKQMYRPAVYHVPSQKRKTSTGWKIVPDVLTTLALAPHNDTDVACGHASGRIHILQDFVSSYHNYMVLLSQKRRQEDPTHQTHHVSPYDSSKVLAASLVQRTLHWHAHAVSSLAFETTTITTTLMEGTTSAEPFLYSGGTESVLVGWQLARGVDKPSWLMPRIAPAEIAHVVHVAASSGGTHAILVACTNGSLHVFQAHNKHLKWSVTSLPSSILADDNNSSNSTLQMRAVLQKGSDFDRKKYSIVYFGSTETTSGFIQWADPGDNDEEGNGKISKVMRGQHGLEVASYNRVSRTDEEDLDLPKPTVTHATWNESGHDLLTVDVICTEIPSYGVPQTHAADGNTHYGSLTSLKFWSRRSSTKTSRGRSSQQDSYQVVAELSSPHGKPNSICAAAISKSGNLACTVSMEERSFRVWQKKTQGPVTSSTGEGGTTEATDGDASAPSAQWSCRYRIVIPSGFSNFDTQRNAIDISPDDSTLAIGFGNFITLWDVEDQVMLASLPHHQYPTESIQAKESLIDQIEFLPNSSRLCDMLLISSTRNVSLQSPFGHCGAENIGWRWIVPPAEEARGISISTVEYVGRHQQEEIVAVTLYDESSQSSRCMLINAETGVVNPPQDHLDLPGKVLSICRTSVPSTVSSWVEQPPTSAALHLLFSLQDGRTFQCSAGSTEIPSPKLPEKASLITKSVQQFGNVVPSIPFLSDHTTSSHFHQRPKRTHHAMTASELSLLHSNNTNNKEENPYSNKKPLLSLEHFGHVQGQEMEQELPLLRGRFARAFLARHLFKKDE